MDIGALITSLGADLGPLNRTAKQAEGTFRRFQNDGVAALGRVKKAVFSLQGAFGGLTVAMASRAVFGAIKGYETALVDMGKVTDQTFEDIDKRIKAMPAALGSSTQLMKGYYQTISAGVIDAAKAQDLLTIASKLGKTSHVDQGDTVKALTKLMKGYQGELANATTAADLLMKTEKLGQTNVAELVPVIGDLANISHMAGIRAEEMAGALALVTQTAGSTAEAGTQYKAFVRSIIKPSKEMKDIFKEFATVGDAVTQLGLVEFLQRVAASATDAQQAAKILKGRSEALLGYSALLSNNFVDLANNIKELENRTGTLDKAWKEYSETLEGIWDNIKNVGMNLLIKMGHSVLPMIKLSLILVTEHTDKLAFAIAALGVMLVHKGFGMFLTWTGVATKGLFTLRVAAVAATTALRFLGRIALYGIIVEGIVLVINAITKMNTLVKETPATWGTAARLAADAFVNNLVNSFIALGRGMNNVIRVLTDPLIAAFAELGSSLWDFLFNGLTAAQGVGRVGEAMKSSVGVALERVGKDFSVDMGRRIFKIANDVDFFLKTYGEEDEVQKEQKKQQEVQRKQLEAAVKVQMDVIKKWQEVKKEWLKEDTTFQLEELKKQYAQFKLITDDKLAVEQWFQEQKQLIEMRAADATIELYEQLFEATGHDKYAEAAIAAYKTVLDAQEASWTKMIGNAEAANILRMQLENDYVDGIRGAIDEVVKLEKSGYDERLAQAKDFASEKQSTETDAWSSFTNSPMLQGWSTYSFQGNTYGTLRDAQKAQRAYQSSLDDLTNEQIRINDELIRAEEERVSIAQRAAEQAQREYDSLVATQLSFSSGLYEASETIDDFIKALGVGGSVPVSSLKAYTTQYESLLTSAYDSEDAIGGFLGFVEEYLAAQKQMGGANYGGVYTSVVSDIKALQDMYGLYGSLAELGLGETAGELSDLVTALGDLGISIGGLQTAANLAKDDTGGLGSVLNATHQPFQNVLTALGKVTTVTEDNLVAVAKMFEELSIGIGQGAVSLTGGIQDAYTTAQQNPTISYEMAIIEAPWMKTHDTTDMRGITTNYLKAANPMDPYDIQYWSGVGWPSEWAQFGVWGPGGKDGGIFSGPDSGHVELLHGTELVIPMEGRTAVPVEIQGELGPKTIVIQIDGVEVARASIEAGRRDNDIAEGFREVLYGR